MLRLMALAAATAHEPLIDHDATVQLLLDRGRSDARSCRQVRGLQGLRGCGT